MMTNKEQDIIADNIIGKPFEENKKYTLSPDFIDLINSVDYKSRTDKFKNMIIYLLETEKDEEGYYLDSFSKRITYNGIKTLKRENVQTNWTPLQRSEYIKCSADFEYFFFNYCKIMTKKGYNFPEIREYQERMIHGMQNFNRLLLSIARQMGKTVLVSSYILWKTMFGKNTTHGIAAQLKDTATEVLDKFKEILFGLPFIFLPGTKVFNKGMVSFDNGVRIICSTANGNAFRGFSIIGEEIKGTQQPSGAVLYIDEAAYIANNDVKDFEDSVLPTVESVPNSQIFKSSTAKGRNHWFFEVDAAKKNDFLYKPQEIIKEINMTANEALSINYKDKTNIVSIKREDKNIIVKKHKGKNNYHIVEANYIDRFPNDPEGAKLFKETKIAEKDAVFFQQAHANEFLGSSYTLIDDKKLAGIEWMDDEEIIHDSLFNGLRIFEEPKPGHNYILTADPKQDGIDAIGLHVIDVTNIPFKQVASANLKESFMVIPNRVFDLGTYYNNAYLVQENNVEANLINTIHDQLEYEGEIFRERKPSGKGFKNIWGIRTTTKTKKMMVSFLKKFVEEDLLQINDKKTIDEMFNFIEKKNGSYSAEAGYADDLVMSLMLVFAPFLDIKNWDDFKGFSNLLEMKKEQREQEEKDTTEFLDLGFAPDSDTNDSPFTEGAWDNDGFGMSAMEMWEQDNKGF